MGQAIGITRTDLTVSELRVLAVRIDDGAMVRGVLAIALLLEGHSREASAAINGMTRQTLRDWVHRHNAAGVPGLRSRTGPGRPPRLTDGQMEELKGIVINGPDPERHKVLRCRCVDLREEITAR
jgi:transposase